MKIQEKDQYHGSALTQIVEHRSFKALNRASRKYGHYLVNTNRHVFVKYRTSKRSPWQFVLTHEEIRALRRAFSRSDKVFVCLVCGSNTVCGLKLNDIRQILDLSRNTQQWITVDVPSGGSCHVHGSTGRLVRTIPHNSFPNRIFS